jgi:cell division initiation protein
MKLTPLDIRRSEFSRAFRGYNREEVEGFLTTVADDFESVVGENRELARRLEELEKEVDAFREMERTLMDTLVSAQRTADDTRESTDREAEVIKREAKVRADQMVDAARIEAERLLLESRRQAHKVVEEARQKAYEAMDIAQKKAEKLFQTAANEAADVQRQTGSLARKRNAFADAFKTFLQSQLDSLVTIEGEEAPSMPAVDVNRVEQIAEGDVEAMANLDKELAEFAAATAPSVSPTSKGRKSGSSKDAPDPERSATALRDDDDGEVLVDGTA